MQNSLDVLAGLLAAGFAIAVFYTFLIGGHYIIPTILLLVSVVFLNLAYYGFRNNRAAKTILFWFAVLVSAHAFFAIFNAITPPKYFGPYFLPIYITVSVVFAGWAIGYSKVNSLFASK